MLKERAHIKSLYERRAKNDENSSTLAQTLETNIYTNFKGEHKFIFELLQNADDSAEDKESIEVRFILASSKGRSYLIFSHNGKHFSEQDVEKICDNGQQHLQEKSINAKKIGYKGIGFKAVFSIADCVHVVSGGYNFRFDQGFFERRKEGKKSFPWPIIPIQNEAPDLSEDVKRFITKTHVTFVLQIRPDVTLENEMKFIIENRALMLFLRNVTLIELRDNRAVTKIRVESKGGVKKFFVNDVVADSWIIQGFTFDIPETMKSYLKTLQDSECPQRLKAALQTKVTFAAQVDENKKIIQNMSRPLCCYLPTQIRYGFPFVVNADFLLTYDRSRLIENDWNAFLMFQIGYFQLMFLAHLCKDPNYQTQIFKLLPAQTEMSAVSNVAKQFVLGFDRAVTDVAFIPTYVEPERLIKVSEVIYDQTGFYYGINNPRFLDGFLISNKHESLEIFLARFGNPKLNFKMKRLIDFDALLVDLETLVTIHKTIDFQKYILKFLDHYTQGWPQLKEKLITRKFILSSSNTILAPNELYIPTENLKNDPVLNELSLVHLELLEFTPFLRTLGVRTASRIEFIRGTIKMIILKSKVSQKNIANITRIIFQAFTMNELEKEDWSYIRKLPLITKKGSLKCGYQCYLSDEYEPTQKLEEILKMADVFVSKEYLRISMEPKKWRAFFLKLEVSDDIKVRLYAKIYREQLLEKPNAVHYLALLKREGSSPQRAMQESEMANHYIDNFIDINLIEYSHEPAFADLFWERLVASWKTINSYSQDTSYHLSTKSNAISTTYLQFCFACSIPVLSNTQMPRMAKELFSPTLQEMIGEALEVARINVPLTEEQAKFFGFKTTLTVDNCLFILSHINNSNQSTNPNRYVPVLKYLLKLSIGELDQDKLKQWRGYLLSQSNTLQQPNVLCYSSVMVELSKGQSWLKNFPSMNAEEMERLARLFGIAIVGQEAVAIHMATQSPEDSQLAQEAVRARLSVMALIEGAARNVDPTVILKFLLEKFESLTFISAHRLSIKVNRESRLVSAFIHNNCLYFEKKHSGMRTRYEFCKKLASLFNLTEHSTDTLHTYFFIENEEELHEYLRENDLDPRQLPKLEKVASLAEKNTAKETSNKPVTSVKTKPTVEEVKSFAEAEETEEELIARLTETTKMLAINPQEDIKQASEDELSFLSPSQSSRTKKTDNLDKFIDPSCDASAHVTFEKAIFHKRAPSSFKASAHAMVCREDDEEYILTQSQRSKIGRLGEKIVYDTLMQHYQKKYSDCLCSDTKQGFKIEGHYINKKTRKLETLVLEVIWYNKGLPVEQDAGEDKDFTIIKNGNIRHVEVKATPSPTKDTFRITHREWAVLRGFTTQYRIFRVFNVGKNNPSILKIKNPAKEIDEGNIQVRTYEVSVNGVTSKPLI